jgi:thioredoxin 1
MLVLFYHKRATLATTILPAENANVPPCLMGPLFDKATTPGYHTTIGSPGAILVPERPVKENRQMAEPVHVSDATFEAEVLKSDVPTLNDFWAEWCSPCKMIAPILKELAAEYDGKLKITKLDVDESPSTAMAYGVMSIPTLILFKDGQPVERLVGYMPKERLLQLIIPYLA